MAQVLLTKQQISKLTNYLGGENALLSSLSESERQELEALAECFRLKQHNLYYYDTKTERLLDPVAHDDEEQIQKIFYQLHNLQNHAEIDTLNTTIQQLYFGFPLQRLPELWQACSVCQNQPQPSRYVASNLLWRHMQVECIDMREFRPANGGYGWIMTLLDLYSRHITAVPMVHKSAECVTQALHRLFASRAPPRLLQTNDRVFASPALKQLLESMGIEHWQGRSQYLPGLRQVRRANKTLIRTLHKCYNRKTGGNPNNKPLKWYGLLCPAVIILNQRVNPATGKCPIEMVNGWAPTPILNQAQQDIWFREEEAFDSEMERLYFASDSSGASNL
ncbi:hypothetical protein NEHOM01_1806 [Nematocida homosporus]|uniref:uncharacterized protein n=1 Tax=Nematocida homosporus TaxID=1912981 RepID=UPI00221FA46C|nr:uncharacterized protein NEHOM01_1806 [Nematocida homosporus]KAI5186922.1 hypothetical protein NEHOM01_1806 [Nematocida homosporus]